MRKFILLFLAAYHMQMYTNLRVKYGMSGNLENLIKADKHAGKSAVFQERAANVEPLSTTWHHFWYEYHNRQRAVYMERLMSGWGDHAEAVKADTHNRKALRHRALWQGESV